MSSRQYFVYMMSNEKRKVLYTGVTNNLSRRVWEHKSGIAKGFTSKYRVYDLMYYEIFDNPESAIAREKQIKSWSRRSKNKLIATKNPNLLDLCDTLT